MALVRNGKVALVCFVMGASILLIPEFGLIHKSLYNLIVTYWKVLIAVHIGITNIAAVMICRGDTYQVAIRALWLGIVFGLSLVLGFSASSLSLLGWYVAALALFHWSEYFTTAYTNPRNLNLESFLLDHSKEYHIAIIASFVEFFIECFLYPSMKTPFIVNYIGLLLVFGGEFFRKKAMLTARSNFNHYVQHIKQEGHQLVTEGIYSYVRHPSYVGWFYWSVGTQLMMLNPVCFIAYTLVSWKFFNDRIVVEEIALLNFFGEDYLDYQKKVGTGLPFIKGYRMEL